MEGLIMSKKNKAPKTYYDRVHAWGRISTISALCVLLMFPVAICLYLNVFPPISGVLQGLLKLIPTYWTVAVVEVLVYTPMLGAGGTYLSFVTGNIANLKLPCAISAMEGADVKANSEEGEVISTIAIGVSAIVTTVIIAVGVLAFAPFLGKLTDPESVLAPAFDRVTPALFGALLASYLRKFWRISILPLFVGCVVLVFVPTLGAGTLLFVTIVVSILGVFALSKFNLLESKKK
jgi:hypothetical protein